MTLCSVIIPVRNRASLTRQCLTTLLANPPANVEMEIIVVDDASTDDTPALLARYGQRIRGVSHPTNTGFAISCNDGAAMAQGEYLVFLNNDTIPQPGWLDAVEAYAARHPNAAVVGSKLVFPNGTIQHAGVAICQDRNPRHIYAGFPADHPAVNKSRRFQIVTGACMLVRRALFEQIDGFDTAFLNGHEDVDLCLRLGTLGYEVHYCHESVLTHLESVSRGHLTEQALANGRLYSKRWHGRVVPDDLRYYAEDGLITVGYPPVYPVNIGIAPLLANIASDERNRSADQLLMARSRQVLDLLRDNISLNVRVQEAEYQATTRARLEPNRTRAACAGEPLRPVSIIIPVYNAFDHLVSTLDSLRAQTDLDVHSVIIIDDASTDERVRDHLEDFARQTPFATSLIRNEQNEGFPRSVNRAIQQSTGDVVLLNSDTVV
ncbi:MAG: glycosyltransferase, partial [Hyphomicrobiales bacterium]|nr:glycosyltransferase [Hyphomicrobiales bacterium]